MLNNPHSIQLFLAHQDFHSQCTCAGLLWDSELDALAVNLHPAVSLSSHGFLQHLTNVLRLLGTASSTFNDYNRKS